LNEVKGEPTWRSMDRLLLLAIDCFVSRPASGEPSLLAMTPIRIKDRKQASACVRPMSTSAALLGYVTGGCGHPPCTDMIAGASSLPVSTNMPRPHINTGGLRFWTQGLGGLLAVAGDSGDRTKTPPNKFGGATGPTDEGVYRAQIRDFPVGQGSQTEKIQHLPA